MRQAASRPLPRTLGCILASVQSARSWFTAQLVLEAWVEGQPEPVMLIESILLSAESAADAYTKAESWCSSPEHVYRSSSGKRVSQRYVGIHDLEDLHTNQPSEGLVLQVRALSSKPSDPGNAHVRPRSELSAFGGEKPEFAQFNQ
jgi:hypothetical protein